MFWKKDCYIEEGLSQLENNDQFYQKRTRDPTKEFNRTIINTMKEDTGKENLPISADKLFTNHPRTSVFYMLPKIQTPSNPGTLKSKTFGGKSFGKITSDKKRSVAFLGI